MSLELSIVMPCLNEAETIASCIKKAQTFMQENNIDGEVVIGDNGSTDGSQEMIRKRIQRSNRRFTGKIHNYGRYR